MLHSINMLRTLSCYLIVTFHVTEFINANYDRLSITFDLAEPGFHLFLLISGVILILITKPDDPPQKFMLKRIARIVPIYWLTTILAIGLALARPWYFSDAIITPGSIASSFFFLPYEDASGDIQPILYVAWTLGYTMLFYTLFAVSLLAAPGRQALLTFSLLIAVIAGARFIPNETYSTFYGDPILLEFAMGCLLGLVLRRPEVGRWAARTPVWPLALTGVGGLAAATLADYDGLLEVVTFAPAGAFLVFACAAQDLYRAPLKLGILNQGGKISYGVFLIHPLLIPGLGMIALRVAGDGKESALLLLAFVLVLTTILAWLSFRYFEVPANSLLRRAFGLDKSKPRTGPEVQGDTEIRRPSPSL